MTKTFYNPFVRKKDKTTHVMTDVIIALLPCIIMAWVAYGFAPVMVVLTAIGSALITEFIFSMIFCKDTKSVSDGTGIITGILMAFTLGPFTPLHIVAFGGATAVLFGKLLWGGLGRNRFNPALVGREFMTIFFPITMSSSFIWQNKEAVNIEKIPIFENDFLNGLFFRISGAIGEYSVFFLVLGGIYLLIRNRISWHIPVTMLGFFSILSLVLTGYDLTYSFGGLFLGAIYMATDMPTSPSTRYGKLYYGSLLGIILILFLANGVEKNYFSYAILLMNGFVVPVNWIFRPRVWGKGKDMTNRLWQGAAVTVGIIATTFLIIYLDKLNAIMYPVFILIAYTILSFILKDGYRVKKPF